MIETEGIKLMNVILWLLVTGIDAQLVALGILSLLDLNPFSGPVNVDPTVNNMYVPHLLDIKYRTWIAAAAYCPTQDLNRWECSFCRKANPSIKFIAGLKHAEMDTSGFIALDEPSKSILISFSGTNNTANRLTNLEIFTTPLPAVNEKNIYVHKGFLDSTMSLMPKTLKVLRRLNAIPRFRGFAFTFVGHSLGGSMAALAAIHVQAEMGIPWGRIQVFTYGQPRTGNRDFAQWFNRQPITLARTVNGDDVVPHLLGGSLGYFAHHQNEVFLDPNISPNKVVARLCNDKILEDPNCSNSIPTSSYTVAAHKVFFDVDFNIPCRAV